MSPMHGKRSPLTTLMPFYLMAMARLLMAAMHSHSTARLGNG